MMEVGGEKGADVAEDAMEDEEALGFGVWGAADGHGDDGIVLDEGKNGERVDD